MLSEEGNLDCRWRGGGLCWCRLVLGGFSVAMLGKVLGSILERKQSYEEWGSHGFVGLETAQSVARCC